MAHIFFFSYASENYSSHLRDFFDDLCSMVAPFTPWAAEDPNISFRDGKNLPLMDEWRQAIMDAVQSSSVFVSVTSPAYFQKPFCGQEYWVFDQRRRQVPGPPEVVLPIIWVPVRGPLPIFNAIQWQAQGISPLYAKKGLLYLKIFDRNEYEKCVYAFADAIQNAWNQYRDGTAIPALPGVAPFDQIPNAFAGGNWTDAADSKGWIPGPGVANFVFAAARDQELPVLPGRYGKSAAEWRPYLPPDRRTIADIARAAAQKHSLRYREIPVDNRLAAELTDARGRKNLTLVLADPLTLPIPNYHSVNAYEATLWEGTALLLLWDDAAGRPWDTLEAAVAKTFPVSSQLKAPAYHAPIRTMSDLDKLLDITLGDLVSGLTQAETRNKARTDEAPTRISGASGDSV